MKRILIALVVGVLAAGCISSNVRADATSEANKALVLKFADLLFVQHKVDEAVDTYLAPDYIQHNPAVPTGREPVRVFFKQFYATTPQAHIAIKRVLADGDLVALHYNGVFSANPADRGAAVVDIFRISHGKIVEHWDVITPVPEKSANDNGMF